MDVNKLAARLALLQACMDGIRRHFKDSKLDRVEGDSRASILRVKVLGLTFELTVREVPGDAEAD